MDNDCEAVAPDPRFCISFNPEAGKCAIGRACRCDQSLIPVRKPVGDPGVQAIGPLARALHLAATEPGDVAPIREAIEDAIRALDEAQEPEKPVQSYLVAGVFDFERCDFGFDAADLAPEPGFRWPYAVATEPIRPWVLLFKAAVRASGPEEAKAIARMAFSHRDPLGERFVPSLVEPRWEGWTPSGMVNAHAWGGLVKATTP